MTRSQKVPPSPPPPSPPQTRVWTTLDLIKWTTDFFQKKGIESARLEAEWLLAEVLECPRISLYVDFEKPVPAEKLARYREFVRRRGEAREPLQYIIGHTQFIDLRLKVSPAVLIPRPETELLALWAVERAREIAGERVEVLDLCTGAGCLALYVASKEPRAAVLAADISEPALAVAADNARELKLEERVRFLAGDLFAALPGDAPLFDLLLANPPYIDPALGPELQREVREHEPPQALFAGGAGLEVAGRILAQAPARLKPGAWLGLEIGAGQAESVLALAARTEAFESMEIRPDHARIPRFLTARRKFGCGSAAPDPIPPPSPPSPP